MAESSRPAGATVQANPSNAAEDPQPVAWVQGVGYDSVPDSSRSSEELYGDFDQIYAKQREGAGERREAKEQVRAANRGSTGDGGVGGGRE